jgi:O-antigen/teichoic acid export membrane protein
MDEIVDSRAEALAVGARVVLVLLAVAVVIGEVVVVSTAESLSEQYPEFGHLEAPLLTLAIALGCCIEAVLAVTGLLVGFTQGDRIFGATALRLVDSLVVALAAATVITAASLFFIPGPPALGLLVLAAVLVGLAFVLVLLVLRSLLRRAASMHTELGEVV